ncbi:blue copper protein-like [Lolium perenne]|uniref:blue copper protein-like n=1 Tax=Lolium perenne TaxID=4522 RepID=UPI0021F52240|nr:blue copper protein-like [Lolium perenne]
MSIVVAVYVVALFPATASAATAYMVGDDDGWNTGVDYSAWVEGKEFVVGDTLEFVYSVSRDDAHTVVVMDEGDYNDCTSLNYLPTLSSGDDTVVLRQSGTWYFSSGVGGDCNDGLKLSVDVQ